MLALLTDLLPVAHTVAEPALTHPRSQCSQPGQPGESQWAACESTRAGARTQAVARRYLRISPQVWRPGIRCSC